VFAASDVAKRKGDGEIVDLARGIAKEHGFVGITMLNDGFASTALSWLCNTESFGSHKYVLFIATDDACVERLTRWRAEHKWKFAVARFAPEGGDDATLQDSFSITQVGYWKWLRHRVRLFNAIIEQSIDFLLFETDAVWFRCAFREWKRTDQVDMVGIRDGSQATAIGFGFLGVRANERVRELWRTLTTRFDTSIDSISHLDSQSTIAVQPLSEQHILSELVVKKIGGVRFEFLPAAEYANGKWFSEELVRRSAPSPVVINFNWIKGLPAKIALARLWRHWFVDDAQQCTGVEHLSQTLISEPLLSFNQTELHWNGCPCGPAGLACWCRCCANDAGGFREQCKATGFCESMCLENDDWCRVAKLAFRGRSPARGTARRCPNRYFHLIGPRVIRGEENLRDLTARAAKTIVLAHLLNRTAILDLPSLTQHLVDGECCLMLREFQDLHTMASMWLNVVVHVDGRLGAECERGDAACLARLSPRANIDIVMDQFEPDARITSRLEPRGTQWRAWPRDAPTLRRGLEMIANDIDPVILSVHDEIDLKSPTSGVDHASVGIALAKIGPAELMRDEQHSRQLRS
jgi:hypothetical protein